MTRLARRRQLVLGTIAVLPMMTALLLLRPAPARGQDPAVGFFALTVTAASTNTSGDIGAGGGLTPVDAGAPVVRGRLDNSPTASMIAAAVEPGTLYRTAAALGNDEAGMQVIPLEYAEAAFPGGPAEDVSDPTATGVDGPVTTGTVQARAAADRQAITGSARVDEQAFGADAPIAAGSPLALLRQSISALAATYPTAVSAPADAGDPAVLRQQGGQAEGAATGDPVAGELVASAHSTAETVTIADVIAITDVTGRAVVRLEGGTATADARTTYGGITVGGVPVELSTDGLVVAGDPPLLPGQDAADLEDQLNAALEAAGVTIAPISPIETADGMTATADSGGIRVRVATPANAAVPGNVLDVVVGQAAVTLAASAPLPPLAPLPSSTPAAPAPTPTATSIPAPTTSAPTSSAPTGGTAVQLPPSTASTPRPTAPSVAAPEQPAPEPSMVLAGRRIPRRTALALFGGWQLLSLSTCTLAAFALRGGGGA